MERRVKDIYMYALGALIIIGFFTIIIVVFKSEMPASNKDVGLLVIGVLAAKFSDVVAYFFGSSKSSSDKSEAVNDAAKELAKNSVTKSIDNTVTNITP